MHGHRAAQRRIAREARRSDRDLEAALASVDELRRFADGVGAASDEPRGERENLEFYRVWQRVRRAFGIG